MRPRMSASVFWRPQNASIRSFRCSVHRPPMSPCVRLRPCVGLQLGYKIPAQIVDR
jgi:hypothetical protein